MSNDDPYVGRESLVFYRREAEDTFTPLDTGFTGWAPDQLQGPLITGLLARTGVEAAAALNPELQLIRSSFDLFTRAKNVPTQVRHEVVRQGRKITLIDTFLVQDGRDVARAHMFFGFAGESPDNDLWTPAAEIAPPPTDLTHDGHKRLHFCPEDGWNTSFRDFPSGTRRGLWQRPFELVEGETATGFVLAGFLADLTSFVVNFGHRGIHHINLDANLHLTREPQGEGLGLLALRTVENAGISSGSAMLFDDHGPLGVSSVSAIAHKRRS